MPAISIPRDQNRNHAIAGVLNTDGVTITVAYADPTLHSLLIEDSGTGSNFGGPDASRDDNRVTGMLFTSNADGITPVPAYVDSTNKLKVIST